MRTTTEDPDREVNDKTEYMNTFAQLQEQMMHRSTG